MDNQDSFFMSVTQKPDSEFITKYHSPPVILTLEGKTSL